WVIEISDKLGEEEPEPAFKMDELVEDYLFLKNWSWSYLNCLELEGGRTVGAGVVSKVID
ncbi:unnamed protein product, partial [Dovyalis caffra]